TNMADLVPKQIRVPDSDDTVEFFLIDSAGNSIYLDSLRDIVCFYKKKAVIY
ncbi:unnamed protein product, partial [Rotaria magnacalcarata]